LIIRARLFCGGETGGEFDINEKVTFLANYALNHVQYKHFNGIPLAEDDSRFIFPPNIKLIPV